MARRKKFKDPDLEQLAQMVAAGFSQMATKDELAALQNEFEALRKETTAGFAHVNIELNKHMGNVRKETNLIARRVKRLEEAVFGVGK